MRRTRLVVTLCAAIAMLALPAAAHAVVYPVASSAAFATALNTAELTGASDRIEMAAGNYLGPFSYNGASAVEIVGAGANQTVIQSSAGNALNFNNGSSPGVRVANLGIDINGGSDNSGIELGGANATIEDVDFVASAGSNQFAIIVNASGAVIRRVAINGQFGRGITTYAANTAVSDLTVKLNGGGDAFEVGALGASATLQRAQISQVSAGATAKFSGTLTVSDSLIDVRGVNGAQALAVGDNDNPAPHTSTLTAERVTIVGDADTYSAVEVDAGSANEADVMSATLRDSIVTGIDTPLNCYEIGMPLPRGTITVSNSALPAAVSNSCGDGPSDLGIATTGTTTAAPSFVNAATGDWRLRWDSPLLDLAGVTPAAGLTDLAGATRVVDGNGDGTATADLGAYEYARTAPQIGSASATPSSADPAQPITFSATATDADPLEGALLSYAWAFDDGTNATGASVAHAFAVGGAHSATLTVTDPAGRIAQATVNVSVAAPPVTPAPVTPAPVTPLASDRTAPLISGLTLTPRITSTTGTPKLVARRLAQLRLTLSEAATLRLSFEKAAGRGWKPVTGAVTLKAGKGPLGVRLRGALSARRRLSPGTYRLSVVATDAAGNRSRRVRATFTLLAAKR